MSAESRAPIVVVVFSEDAKFFEGFPTLNKAFGCKVATKEDKPTNGEFIAMLSDKFRLEQQSA
ncbi:MAG: hypothetical protein J6K13_05250 [Clostridia bacterium]|nr:hypothetical protein [Clostridia bacterium]